MPFTTLYRRHEAMTNTLEKWEPGDHCFMEYWPMVHAWRLSPRWTTADRLFGQTLLKALKYAIMFQFPKLKALLLAWQVFFIKFVMPYEDKKEAENGTI